MRRSGVASVPVVNKSRAGQLGTSRSEVLQLPNKSKNDGVGPIAIGSTRGGSVSGGPSRGGMASMASSSIGDGNRVNIATLMRRPSAPFVAASLAVTLLLPGCGMSVLSSGMGGGMFGGGGTTTQTTPRRVTEESMLQAAKAEQSGSGTKDVAHGCPRIRLADRDNHVTIYEAGRVGDGLGVMHRGEITRTARECRIEGGRVTVKYGVAGRILLGPRGRPGAVQLQVLAHASNAKRDRIANDRAAVEATVSPDQPIGYFSTVRTMTFDVPEGVRPGDMDIFVGFDRSTPGAG